MEPSGHMGLDSYFFVPVYSHWDCNKNASVMASDNHSQRHAYLHPVSHAAPQNWLPDDTSIAGDECARITSATLLRKSDPLWCVTHFCESRPAQSLSTSLT